jgi:hypothetical protein
MRRERERMRGRESGSESEREFECREERERGAQWGLLTNSHTLTSPLLVAQISISL